MTVVSGSRRERHRLATRLALHEAALSLTEELGLAGVTVEAITERADVAPRTLANYYPSKEDAVLGHDPDDGTRCAGALLARPESEDAWTALREVLISGMADCVGPAPIAKRRGAVLRREPRLRAASAAHFDKVGQDLLAALCQRNGTDPSTDLEATVLVSAAMNACRAAGQWWSQAQPRPSLEDVLDQAFEMLAKGRPVTSLV